MPPPKWQKGLIFAVFQEWEAVISSIDTIPLTRADVAWLVGMSDSWVRDRMQAGDLPRPGETAEQYVEAFVEYRIGKLSGAGGDGLSLEAERARLAREQADAKAMDNAERRRELASLPDMTAAVTGVIGLAVARLQQIPATVAQVDSKLRKRLETAVNDALEELSVTRVVAATVGSWDEEEAPREDDAPDR